jgi:glycine betaine catabolism B
MAIHGANSDTGMTEPCHGKGARLAWETASVVDIVRRTARIKSFFLALPVTFVHQAGQHVDLRLTPADGYRAVRSYSIASAPSRTRVIELAIERLENGEVSPFFHEVVEIGDEIELRGPLGGHFLWSPADGGPLLLMGGGSGLVPLMAMLRHLRASALDCRAALLLSARTWADILYREELLELEREMKHFSLVLTLTGEAARRGDDFSRRIDTAMVADASARLGVAPKHLFICGSNPFVNAAADGAVAAGIPPGTIRTERYGA